MIPKLLKSLPAIVLVAALASCHSVPKHARYIPKDALMVVGIHTGEMRKELAWSAITGSNLLDEMKKNGNEKGSEMMKDIENSGIDFSSTIYGYTKPDNRFDGDMRMGVVLPVSDAGKVTAFIKKHAPQIAIHTVKDRSEAMLDGHVYIGWNNEVLIAMNPIVKKVEHNEPAKIDTLGGTPYPSEPYSWNENVADSIPTAAEMDLAFNPAKANSIDANSKFKMLENEGHDITLWVSYDAMAEKMNGGGMVNPMGMGMANMLWKSSAMAVGLDFKKGSINAEMKYYSSDSMKPVAREFGKEAVDKDMLRRLPAAGLNAALGYRVSPTALKLLMDRIGLSGLANMALMQQGTNIDDILGAFSGDMVASVNNFKVETKMQDMDSATQKAFGMTPYPVTAPKMDFVYAIKIGDKAKMNKLIGFLSTSKLLTQIAPNKYSFPNSAEGFTLIVGDKYVVAGSVSAMAEGFLKDGATTMPDAVNKEIAGHVTGLWADVHSFMTAAAPLSKNSASDSSAYAVVRNMFTTFSMSGGEFKSDANVYTMSLGFMNKDENSLVQLMHMAQQLSALNDSKKPVAFR